MGASEEYWKGEIIKAQREWNAVRKEFDEMPGIAEIQNAVLEGRKTEEAYIDEVMKRGETDQELKEVLDRLEKATIKKEKLTGTGAKHLYFDTAGEIEARDTGYRANMSAEERKKPVRIWDGKILYLLTEMRSAMKRR